jgi:hypothetical protein
MLLVHLTPASSASSVRRGGIRPWYHRGLGVRGVYAMPVLPSYVLTYQWGRELRRSGTRTVVAVHFRVPDDEPVWVGHYGRPPVPRSATEAAALVMGAEDPRGYEVFVPRKITAKEIHRLRPVNPVTGWRYKPGSHGTPPCACPVCLPVGSFGAAKIRERYGDPPSPTKPELMRRLAAASTAEEIVDALWSLANGRWRGAEELAYLAEHEDPEVREALAEVLGRYRGPAVRPLLTRLTTDDDERVRTAAVESLAP